jgi:hypothetical protein
MLVSRYVNHELADDPDLDGRPVTLRLSAGLDTLTAFPPLDCAFVGVLSRACAGTHGRPCGSRAAAARFSAKAVRVIHEG